MHGLLALACVALNAKFGNESFAGPKSNLSSASTKFTNRKKGQASQKSLISSTDQFSWPAKVAFGTLGSLLLASMFGETGDNVPQRSLPPLPPHSYAPPVAQKEVAKAGPTHALTPSLPQPVYQPSMPAPARVVESPVTHTPLTPPTNTTLSPQMPTHYRDDKGAVDAAMVLKGLVGLGAGALCGFSAWKAAELLGKWWKGGAQSEEEALDESQERQVQLVDNPSSPQAEALDESQERQVQLVGDPSQGEVLDELQRVPGSAPMLLIQSPQKVGALIAHHMRAQNQLDNLIAPQEVAPNSPLSEQKLNINDNDEIQNEEIVGVQQEGRNKVLKPAFAHFAVRANNMGDVLHAAIMQQQQKKAEQNMEELLHEAPGLFPPYE